MKTFGLAGKIKSFTESWLPMTLSSFIFFCLIIYFLFIVAKTTLDNYHSNQEIAKEKANVSELEQELKYYQYEINYYQTSSFKEKEARAKLGYKAPGENVMSLPIDDEEGILLVEKETGEVKIKTSNYWLWWSYFFD